MEDPAGGHPARVSPLLAVSGTTYSILLLGQGVSLAALLGRCVKRVYMFHTLFEGFPNIGMLKAERIQTIVLIW